MKRINQLLPFIAALLTLSSCNLYNPTFINAPIYKDVGEVNLGVHVGSNQSINASTNPVEHLSVIANANTTGALENQPPTVTYGNPQFENKYKYDLYQMELGVGYYYNLTDDIQHDFYLGYGLGKAGEDEYDFAYQVTQQNFFIQSSLTYHLAIEADFVISSKFNRLSYDDFKYTTLYNNLYYSNNPYLTQPVEPQFNRNSFWMNQFSLGLVSNLGPVDVSVQAQIATRFSQSLSNDDTSPLAIFVGANFNLDQIFKKKE